MTGNFNACFSLKHGEDRLRLVEDENHLWFLVLLKYELCWEAAMLRFEKMCPQESLEAQ